jgi:hypothetical protein
MNTKTAGLSVYRSRELASVLCSLCGKEFKRAAHHHRFAVKKGNKEFCGENCRRNDRKTAIEISCSNCYKKIIVKMSRMKKTKNQFCSNSCAASFNNKARGGHSEETKRKISQSLDETLSKSGRKIEIKKCPLCGNEFRKNKVCCSVQCDRLYRFGGTVCGKDDVIGMIMGIFSSSGRTPMKRDVKSRMYHAAVSFFGSWNKAIESCGFKANGNSPRNIRLKCSDGHVVRSISEKIIDEWLHNNGIKHEVNKSYPVGKFTCDFYLIEKNVWLEYFGLSGSFKDYDETIQFKIDMTNERGMKLISLFPHHLYPDNKLDEVLKDYL